MISGTFLRTSIDDYLADRGLSSENILTLEYVRSILPPLYQASFEHDDWVSSIDVLSRSSPAAVGCSGSEAPIVGQGRVLSGSYDGLLRVWNMSSQVLATSQSAMHGGHKLGIKAARFLSTSQLVSSSLDRTIRVWSYSMSEDQLSAIISPELELYGHRASVDDVAVHRLSGRILSASADHTVGVWSTDIHSSPLPPESLKALKETSSAKRRKLKTDSATPQRGPLLLLQAHSAPVSAVTFASSDATVAYSTSWDHTIRTWDLPTASLVDTRTTAHALLSIEPLSELNLLATGTSARHITLIDPRVSATTVSAMTLRGHSNAVVTLARDPENAFRLLSGSHDGQCRIWDVRSTKPGRVQDGAGIPEGAVGESVYTIDREAMRGKGRRVGGEGSKVFSVVWDREVGIVSAGEDKRVQLNKSPTVSKRDKTEKTRSS